MEKKYKFESGEAVVVFSVDTGLFAQADAEAMLWFCDWEFNRQGDMIQQLVDNLGREIIRYDCKGELGLEKVIETGIDYLVPDGILSGEYGMKLIELKATGYDPELLEGGVKDFFGEMRE